MKMELFDPQSVSDDTAIYLVNVVHVEEGAQDLAVEILEDTVNYVARTYSAFQWSRLMKSTDGKTVINQAQWSDRGQFESLFIDEEFLSRYSRLKENRYLGISLVHRRHLHHPCHRPRNCRLTAIACAALGAAQYPSLFNIRSRKKLWPQSVQH